MNDQRGKGLGERAVSPATAFDPSSRRVEKIRSMSGKNKRHSTYSLPFQDGEVDSPNTLRYFARLQARGQFPSCPPLDQINIQSTQTGVRTGEVKWQSKLASMVLAASVATSCGRRSETRRLTSSRSMI